VNLPTPEAQQLHEQGWVALPAVCTPSACQQWAERCQSLSDGAGVGSRDLLDQDWCAELAIYLHGKARVLGFLPDDHLAVQCNYFEKRADRNWLVPMHQDLSIAVAERVAEPRASGWSIKQGQQFVHAPDEVLPQMLALRLHLDPCNAEDGALRVIPASHREGRSVVGYIRGPAQVAQPCLAQTGDVLAMRPLLMHASSKSASHSSSRRRVLHFVFGPPQLPWGLRWARSVAAAPDRSQLQSRIRAS